MPKTSQSIEEKTSLFDLANNLLSDLPERVQEIVKKRFGLSETEPLTLERIGRDHKITRERVRQIIADALKRLAQKRSHLSFKKAEDLMVFTISKNSGIIREDRMVEVLSTGSQKEANSVAFFSSILDNIGTVEEKGKIKKSRVISKDVLKDVREIGSIAREIFSHEEKLLDDSEIHEKISQKIAGKKKIMSKEQVLHYLDVLGDIQKNRFEKWGMADWKEVTPKGTRERIYLILKEKRKPLHFTEIAEFIDRHKLGKRKAHPQTVHNELIKDERFVLVGRGIYALKEWGYEKGTIADVLKDILKKNQKPMDKDEVLAQVLKSRKVKKATIMINLNNSKMFEKIGNTYTIKK